MKFAIDEVTHSGHLALHSLYVLNEQLPTLLLSKGLASDKLWYLCQFWITHLESVKDPCQAFLTSLSQFLKSLTLWIELHKGEQNFPGTGHVISWAHVCIDPKQVLALL